MRWPFVSRARYEEQRAVAAHAIERVGSLQQGLDLCRGELHMERALRANTERELAPLRVSAALDRGRLHELTLRLADLAAPKQAPVVTQPEPPHVPVLEEERALRAVSDQTVKNMAAQFERDGIRPDAALAHAQELARLAEQQYCGV